MTTTPAQPVADRAHGLGPTRARVLGTLQDLRAPSTAAEVAERLGIHLNTARFHLDGLVASGLAERAPVERRGPGRPQVHYAATRGAPQAAHRSYRLLAEILSRHLARHADDPGGEGLEAGRDYGRFLVREPGAAGADAPGHGADLREARGAVATVVETLDRLGFDSRPVEDGARLPDVTVEVTNCPFLEVAEGHLEVVCAVHRGLMEGMLDELGAPVGVARLDPLVSPSRCLARFATRPSRPATTPGEQAPR
ncbi:MAG: helix-turn-helix domain-containing protein [Intrasporangium sp.]|uniref:helix-turn-helix transcriptional regulator n=1 Tax=Intrasporangium sp. TaxID=1925024 RepID=UPI002648CD53|nr:helix-turn-helix domain-containing protein [Intrasporangium sp.]MDN5798105.1 helix-turn-helix domain-containing protein [Intrasporangium sp.]